jgi:hypothetical protein
LTKKNIKQLRKLIQAIFPQGRTEFGNSGIRLQFMFLSENLVQKRVSRQYCVRIATHRPKLKGIKLTGGTDHSPTVDYRCTIEGSYQQR